MLVNSKAKDVDLIDEVKQYAESKVEMLDKLLADVPDENISYDIEFAKGKQHTGSTYRADITLHAGATRLHAVGHGESLNAAIDEAKDDLERRMRREKTKGMTMLRKGSQAIKRMLRFGS